jgi:Phosphoesterase family
MTSSASFWRSKAFAVASVSALAVAAMAALPGAAASAAPATHHSSAHASPDGLGIKPGKIKHVWLIILENKSYDATFTGLNDNTYLWKTLPAQGVLLKHYYGTGHFSLDNYISLVSGQATQPDTQADCPFYDQFSGTVDTSGSLRTNPDYGQVVSAAGPNAAAGSNGCVYPATVPTLFNQLDAAGVSWKGYAQDLGNPDASLPTHDAGVQYCGAPYASAGATGSTAQPNPGSANATDQYVPKHFPFPWFDSILQSGDCDAAHIASLFDPSNGLYHDLQSVATTPAFSWISPNNCSDAHDAVCHGNNLSGGFSDPNTPNAPVNYTGGLYAADLFLEHVVPEIEQSPAFKDGGLIDITFDEAFPPFTYTGNSFSNSTIVSPNAAASIASDTAGETLFGHTVHWEPTGPNTPLKRDASGNELYPGPGDNAFVDRPSSCVAQTVPAQPAGTCLLGGGSSVPGARTDAGATAASGSSTIADNSAVSTDMGRSVTGTGIPAGAFVGQVTDTPATPAVPNQSGGLADTGSFTLVDGSGNPLLTTGAVSGVTLGARTPSTDPLFSATGATNGGGDTGSVLISPYIRPGSVSNRYYNHYSWLRTMEDLFNVGWASPGLDGHGHIGYAAQPGLAPFGKDVFNSPSGNGHHRHHPGHGPWAASLAGLVVVGAVPGLSTWRRRRRGSAG